MQFQDLLAVVETAEAIYAENRLGPDPTFALMIQKPAPIDDRGRVLVMSSPLGEKHDLWGQIDADYGEVLRVIVRCQDFRLATPVKHQLSGQGSH